ncbi:hypothetical protein EDEG_00023 [Edhazardia aedis USNM 41457]|uniref:DNA polymerase delta catalytic subunit n=1 Tax=Edhazardia aedis (strain USNM 41457) TaxID=1003232 RepID=J9D1H6_EDHAE|nr:hypothetical protein EDEG_00023 [Edhazardia aedis USNM 41457]|eukprot:EJW01429.1 hypothetical protein EDEG_00023 [Edhazardia aedis USNM 41457]
MSNSKIFLQTHVDHYHDDVRDRPVIRIFGTEKNGTPVLCHVHGFFPYFYVDHYQIEKLLEIKGFTDLFSASFNTQYKKNKLLAVEIVEKQSVYNYSDGKTKFLKLVFNNVSSIKQVKSFLESGIVLNGRRFMFRVYENHVAYVLRFMIDKNMYGMSYVEAKNFDWIECDRVNEISVDVSDLNCVAHAGEFEKLPPLKILSFDIECIGPTDAFPTAKEDPVIQIGNTTAVSNDYDNVQKTIFTLGSCAPIPGANVISFDDEKKLIESWRDYFVNEDPDIVIGYNIKNFDFPYLQDRAHILQIENFASVGRSSRPMKIRDQVFSSRQVGNRASKEIEIDGRIIFDMLSVIRRDFNLRSYTLNSVSVHFLKEQKEDVPYSSMRSLQQGDQETRKRIATYCLRDTYLPLRLFKILNVLANYSEMARVTGVPIEYLSTRGQAIKVLSQILRKAKEEGYVLPQISPSGDERSFEGGFVMAPEKGFYASPIAVLDFSSLYPSIMIVHNLCYTTLLTKKQVDAIYRKFGRRAGEPENGAKTDREDNFIFACSKSESTLECSANKTRSLNSASKENKSISKIDDDSFEIGDFSAEENLEDFISNEKNKNDDEKNASNYSTNNNISNGDFNMESFYNLGDLRPEDIEQSPSGNYFVKESKKKGLLPVILTSLISERKKQKK